MCLMRMNTLQQAPCNLRLSFQSEIAVVSNDVLDSNTTYLEGNTRKLLQFNCFPERSWRIYVGIQEHPISNKVKTKFTVFSIHSKVIRHAKKHENKNP